jgi:hypothetical protein
VLKLSDLLRHGLVLLLQLCHLIVFGLVLAGRGLLESFVKKYIFVLGDDLGLALGRSGVCGFVLVAAVELARARGGQFLNDVVLENVRDGLHLGVRPVNIDETAFCLCLCLLELQ